MKDFGYNPDVLACLANLSSDEVFTPPKLSNEILDQLPNHVWKNDEIRFLDPVSKSGVFLREVTIRLINGLENKYPNLEERINHILTKQVFGISISEVTSLISKRSLYCSKDADSKYSICSDFYDVNGNIYYEDIDHTWKKERCLHCGASKNEYQRNTGLEKHAYNFIHLESLKNIFNMKFDIIIGNPPYHLSDAGETTGSSPIYQKFVDQAKKLNPRYLSMIIPSRWFAGGKNLKTFRDEMLSDKRITRIVDYPIASDVFPGLKVIGGVCYFFWDNKYNGPCEVITKMGSTSDSKIRNLDEFDVFVRFNQAVSILNKVLEMKYSSLSNLVSKQKPFGLRTYEKPKGSGDIDLYARKSKGKYLRKDISQNSNLIDNWNVYLSMAYGEGGEARDYPRRIIGKPIVAKPPSVCTETYLVIGSFNNSSKANNLEKYLNTKFVRFLIGLRKNTQHITSDRFKFVPDLSMDNEWNDNLLFEHFNLDLEEINFINSLIK